MTQTAQACNDVVIAERPGAAEGSESRGGTGVRAWMRAHARPLVTWAAVLFIASLAVPAVTKQWNDRQQELQVKESLMTDISTMSANAVYGAVQASRQTGARQDAARSELVYGWLRDRAAIDPRFRVYFDHSDAATHWFGREQPDFRDALLMYVHLACCDRTSRDNRITKLQSYLEQAGVEVDPSAQQWRVLSCGPQEECSVHPTYSGTYQWLGNQLLDQRRLMLEQLLAANGEGFSNGWRDFIGDLNPLD
jgi:hypothetical protein